MKKLLIPCIAIISLLIALNYLVFKKSPVRKEPELCITKPESENFKPPPVKELYGLDELADELALTPPDLSGIIEDELKKLAPGKILFNPPQEMQVGVRDRIEVRIAKTITEDLSLELKGRGVPQIEEIRVGTFMKVRLMGNNFDIKPLSHKEQLVAGEGFTQWDWDVVPLKSGMQSLLLVVTVRIKIPNYDEERKDYPVFERQIKVKVNLIYSISSFVYSYWQWIAGTITSTGIIGWFIKWIIKKRRQSRKKR